MQITQPIKIVEVPEFSRSENAVQERLRAILEYWGPRGERHLSGAGYLAGTRLENGVMRCCAIMSLRFCGRGYGPDDAYDEMCRLLYVAARERGFRSLHHCSDSSFTNARAMVLRAITLAGEKS